MLSKSHAKYIQSLHHKKFRDEEDLFFAEGPKLVEDMLKSGRYRCRLLLGTAEWADVSANALKEYFAGTIETVTADELKKISALTTPNRVLAVFEKTAADAEFAPGQLTLVLDGVQDPGNMGTILRTADWFGIGNVVCTPQCADCYNPKVVQGSMGSIARLNIVYTDVLEWLGTHKTLPVYGAMLEGADINSIEKPEKGVLIAGSEGRGISTQLQEQVRHRITIPGKGGAESLNVAVAVGIILARLT